MDFKSTGLNYTKEEIEINGNQVPLGKLHDEVCDYMENEWKASESEILNISTALWKALEVLNKELIKRDEQIKELDNKCEEFYQLNGKIIQSLKKSENKYQKAVKDIEWLNEKIKTYLNKSGYEFECDKHEEIVIKYGLNKHGKES